MGSLGEFLAQVLDGGVDVVQLRDKHADARSLLEAARVIRRRTREFGALFIVNDRVDLALAAEADGVHLGQQDLPVEEARRQMGPGALIGLSTHSQSQILTAPAAADYIGVGPVLETPTKPGRPAVGTALVSFAAQEARQPFFAIGGIDATVLPAVLAAGATRVAVVRALTHADDPGGQARALSLALRGGRGQPRDG